MSIEGRRIGDYHVLRRLGVGGMAEVYVAERRGPAGFRRAIALKVLRAHLRETHGVTDRFTREARLAAALRHPNLVPVIDFGLEDGVAFLAMELVDGPDLRRATEAGARTGRPLPARLAVHVAIQVARGLAHAHRHAGPDGRPLGLVHRDVSPQNILLSRSGEVRLTDFGIATAAWAADESLSGTLRGKLAYLAPEQIDGATPDARADVFGLGVVLWELLARRRLFLAATHAETLARVRRCEVALPPGPPADPDVPPAVWPALGRALERSPASREPTADGFAAALAAAWPEADRGDASRQLADWATSVDEPALPAGRGATPGRADRSAGAAAEPAAPLTPTLIGPTPLESAAQRARVTPGPRRRPRWRLGAALGLAAVAAAAWLAAGQRNGLGGREGPETAPGPAVERAAGPAASPALPAAPVSTPGPVIPPAATAAAPTVADPARPAATRAPAAAPTWVLRLGSLIVVSRPAGADIEIDGRLVGRTPRRVDDVPAGRPVLLVLRLDGFHAAERAVTPSARAPTTVEVILEEAYGFLSVDAEPWAQVSVDGRELGSTPIFRWRVPAGRRVVRLVHTPTGRAAELVVVVEADQHVRRRVRLAEAADGAAGAEPAAGGAPAAR